MSTIDVAEFNRTDRRRRASAIWSLTAAGLFLVSAALQLVASLQRWVVFRASSAEFVAEDHLYDYSFPRDPWDSIGSSAQLFGAGALLLPLGVLAMAFGVLALPRTAARRGVMVIMGVVQILLATFVAGWFVIGGTHAFVSGATGTPSPLQHYGALGWFGIAGLITLSVLWARRSPAAMMACLFLLGSTDVGYLIAAFQIAPIFAGYVSHDTTPWTETVIAGWTAVVGVAMIFAAGDTVRDGAQLADEPVSDVAAQEH